MRSTLPIRSSPTPRLCPNRQASTCLTGLRPGADDSRLSLFERKSLSIIEGDKIRWTDNDHKRGLFNADQARIVAIDTKGVLVETSGGQELRLTRGEPPFLDILLLAQ